METIYLLSSELKILCTLEKYARKGNALSRDELQSILSFNPEWWLDHYLDTLENDYSLIEEITCEECAAFRNGKNYVDLSPRHPAALSGKYTLTRRGYIVVEEHRANRSATIREWSISVSSALIGGLVGCLASLLIH